MAVPEEIPQGSEEFLEVALDSPDDLTSSVVQIGVTQEHLEQPIGWMAASWLPTPAVNTARTNSVWDTSNVAKGFWAVWAWVQDSPESVPRRYDVVRVV